jgi:hypothetical protein
MVGVGNQKELSDRHHNQDNSSPVSRPHVC